MRLSVVTAYGALFVASFCTVVANKISGSTVLYQPARVDDTVRRHASESLPRISAIDKRTPQASNQSSPALPSTDTSGQAFDEQGFNETVTSSCLNAIEKRGSVVNPTGMAVCYNVAFFNTSTGMFEADIRLYQVTEPTDEFAGISSEDYLLSVMIPQATISDLKRLLNNTSPGQENADGMLQDFRTFGQLATNLQYTKLKQKDFQVLLLPNVTVAAATSNNNTITTTLSSDTLSYLVGFLSNPSNTPTNITVPEAKAQLPDIISSATPFSLPGMTLGIFPTGLIVTSTWAGLFLLVVSYGTFERIRFRDHYRRRIQMLLATKKTGSNRI